MSTLPHDLRTRLSKIAGRMGSEFDGERAVAAQMATKLLRDAGLTWEDVISAPVRPAPRPPRRHWRGGLVGAALAAQCATFPEALSAWERDFLASVSRRWKLSDKQRRTLNIIAQKVRVFAASTGEAAS